MEVNGQPHHKRSVCIGGLGFTETLPRGSRTGELGEL